MGFRFQRRIKIAPGVTINLSKSGVSTSLGPRGARMTFGNGKTRTTVGIPGSGLSYTEVKATPQSPLSAIDTVIYVALFAFMIWILSKFL